MARDVRLAPAQAAIRFRHVAREGLHHYLFFNEGEAEVRGGLEVAARGRRGSGSHPWRGAALPDADVRRLELAPHETRVLRVG